jgi:iron only hydrogenase large subunit-like protein/uncharacterized Fe-S cluster-containing protein
LTEYLRLKKSNCKNCYKCIRHCPVKAIRFSGNQAHIVTDECVLCGECFVVCPQNAKEIIDDTEQAKYLLTCDAPVIASIAPSFVANYEGATIASMDAALKKLGFAFAEETAIGAEIVKTRYQELVNGRTQDVLITSCCHSVNLMIRKHYPEALPFLIPVISPMQAHCADIKRRYPGAKTVFIGPCISKKAEAEEYPGEVDCVLTFEELSRWLESERISIEPAADPGAPMRSRNFPTSGGILRSMDQVEDFVYLAIDGQENCIHAIQDVISGRLRNCFIEMSACTGSCIGGPTMDRDNRRLVRDYAAVSRYAGPGDASFDMPSSAMLMKEHFYLGNNKTLPGEAVIDEILRKMNKSKPEDELNCGSCGYDTCREKAIAVFQGKADLTMCLPFLKEKAESFSDNIIRNTPNGILVLNELFEVQQINNAAMKLLNVRRASDVLGEQVVRIMDPTDFIAVKQTGVAIHEKKVFLAEYDKHAEISIIYDKVFRILMCIMRDITEEETERERKEAVNRQTVETANKVIDKQMRVVQEIASLLGETAAETKIALTKLKESL